MFSDKKEYTFRSFWDREDCFRILTAFLAKYKGHSDADRYKVKVSEVGPLLTGTLVADSADPAEVSESPIINNYFESKTSAAADSAGLVGDNSPSSVGELGLSPSNSSKRLSARPGSVRRPATSSGDNDDVFDTGDYRELAESKHVLKPLQSPAFDP